MTINTSNNKNKIPQSPFFRPSKPKLVTVTQTVTTPRGTHCHILSKTQLLQTTDSSYYNEEEDEEEDYHTRRTSALTSSSSSSSATPRTTTAAAAGAGGGGSATTNTTSVKSFDVLEAKSSLLGTYANLVNAIVGAGIVGIPYALNQTGLIMGILLILFVAALTDYSLRLLIDTGKLLQVHSYELLMEALFGKAGFIFISLSMFVMSYGGMICYLLIIKDTLPTLLLPFLVGVESSSSSTTTSLSASSAASHHPGVVVEVETQVIEWMKQMILIAFSLLIILPLSLQRDMAHLSKTSTISVLFDILLVGIIVLFSPIQPSIQEHGGLIHVLQESTIHLHTLFTGLGVLSFAFVCQDSSFLIAGSLHRPTKQRWKVVVRYAMITCTLLAIIMGVSGYLAFQSTTDGNILNNFSTTTSSTTNYWTLTTSSNPQQKNNISTPTTDTTIQTLDDTDTSENNHLLNRYTFLRHLSTTNYDPTTTTTNTKTLISSDSSHIVSTTKIGTSPKSSHGSLNNNNNTTSTSPPTLLPSQQWAANIARFLLGTTMFFVYPLASFVCRHVLIVLFFQGPIAREGNDHTVLKRADRRVALTVFLYLAALLPALFCDSVGTILAITGAIGGSCLSYVGPGVAFLGAHGQEFLDMVRQRWTMMETVDEGDDEYLRNQLADNKDVENCHRSQQEHNKYSVLWKFPGPSSESPSSYPLMTQNNRSYSRTTGEGTPLLSRECSKDSFDVFTSNEIKKRASSVSVLEKEHSISYWDMFIWYSCCMPLWCTIASIGSRNSQAFIQAEREKHNRDKVKKAKAPKNKMSQPMKPPSDLLDSVAHLNHLPSQSSQDTLEERVSPTRVLKHTFSDPYLDTHRSRDRALNVTIKVGDQVLLVPYPSLSTVRAFVDVSYGLNEHSTVMMDRRTSSSHKSNKYKVLSVNSPSRLKYEQSTSISTQEKEDDLELPSPLLSSSIHIPQNILIQEDVVTAVDDSEEDTDVDDNLKIDIEPVWSDFLLSISYIVLGVVATTAGLLSILSG